jgi:hypothetical protein
LLEDLQRLHDGRGVLVRGEQPAVVLDKATDALKIARRAHGDEHPIIAEFLSLRIAAMRMLQIDAASDVQELQSLIDGPLSGEGLQTPRWLALVAADSSDQGG